MAISFDLDGVLIQNPFASGVVPRMKAFMRQHPALRDLSDDEADAKMTAAVRARWGKHMAAGAFVDAYDWDSIYSFVSESFGGGTAPDVATIVKECCQQDSMIALLPGAMDCLSTLSRKYRLYAATNGYRAYQWPVLEALGIAPCFAGMLSPDTVGYAKPEAGFFKAIPNVTVHVGDTLEHDVLGANQAGIISVWVKPELPESLVPLNPSERTKHRDFAGFLANSLEASLYREYHPEATVETCFPNAVVQHVNEIPAWLG